jgi:hypothetical protein
MAEEFKKGFRKGYEEGTKDALNEAIALALRGHKPQELRILLKSKMTAMDHKIEASLERLEASSARKEPETAAKAEVGESGSYLVKESKFEKSLDMLLGLAKDRKCLCITRINPESKKELLENPNIELFWLTAAEKRQQREYGFISPTDLVALASTMLRFLGENDKGVVLIQGVEYLITQNNFNVILKMIQKVNDSIVLKNSILLLSLNPSGIDKKEYSNLSKEMTHEV